MDRAYKLSRNLDHVRANQDYDIWQVFKNRDEKFNGLFLEPIVVEQLPPHRFEGKLKRLEWLDYPRTNPTYPIMSTKMVEILRSVGEFKHQLFPLEIYGGESKTQGEKTDKFVLLHLPETFDVLDSERSTYRQIVPGTKSVDEAALKKPKGGYLPLFRVDQDGILVHYCVSSEARKALEAAGIKGVSFIPLIAS